MTVWTPFRSFYSIPGRCCTVLWQKKLRPPIIIIPHRSTCKPLQPAKPAVHQVLQQQWTGRTQGEVRLYVRGWVTVSDGKRDTEHIMNCTTLNHLQSGTSNLEMTASRASEWLLHTLVIHLTQIRSQPSTSLSYVTHILCSVLELCLSTEQLEGSIFYSEPQYFEGKHPSL